MKPSRQDIMSAVSANHRLILSLFVAYCVDISTKCFISLLTLHHLHLSIYRIFLIKDKGVSTLINVAPLDFLKGELLAKFAVNKTGILSQTLEFS